MDNQKNVLIAGDMILDFHIYEGNRYHYGDASSIGVQVWPEVGGAALIHKLLLECVAGEQAEPIQPQLAKIVPDTRETQLEIDRSQHSYAFWRSFPQGDGGGKHYWRVSDAMGFGAIRSSMNCEELPDAELPESPHVIAISDGGMGFRQSSCWSALPLVSSEWIVLKPASPLGDGPLWETLVEQHAQKLVLVVSIDDLRKTDARISKGLSWDATLRDVANEISAGGALTELSRCRHLVVSFGSEGALWIDFESRENSGDQTARASFIFDSSVVEGDHALPVNGTAFGFLSCLATALIRQLCLQPPDRQNRTFEQACEGGLSAMRNLRREGHGRATEAASGFPANRLSSIIKEPDWQYSRARFEIPEGGLPSDWSLLKESLQNAPNRNDADPAGQPAHQLARLLALRGPIALDNLPNLQIGHLRSVDRHEIESLRTLMNLMRNYQHHDAGKKPLSIGVFGPPGSGKSFGVKQMAREICGKEGWLEFNLSQFASTEDLIGAFHQIRDRVLSRILPVAFFDEFDSQQYRWLQYLLAPMQDGHFQEGQITHPIGKCIFVFAGGTSWTFETFGPPEDADQTDFRQAKGPDFKSRLDGFLNVIGPNQRKLLEQDPNDKNNYHIQKTDETDICFPLRRAFMIRAELNCAPTEKLKIDEGVLHALLQAEDFRHGSRSLSKILQPLKEVGNEPLYKSLLPPESQIDMHTDAEKFLQNCKTLPGTAFQPTSVSGSLPLSADDPLSESDVEQLAPAIHETYQQLGFSAGWLKPEDAVAFADLKDPLPDSNRAAARRMIRHLALVNLTIESGKNTPEERSWLGRLLEYHLELLAEAEHDGWMKWHFEQGWRYANIPKKDTEKKLHPCLQPYQNLSVMQQDKDRDTIRHYLDFVDMADSKIVPR